ncbi:MAG: L-2-amino-thiazoline-4-carboxylic acid hydrolase [Bacillota bacterium]
MRDRQKQPNRSGRQERVYRRTAASASSILLARWPDLADSITRQSAQEFSKLIPAIPHIGGQRNPFTSIIDRTAVYLALYRSMRSHGLSLQDAEQVLLALAEQEFSRYPAWLCRLIGKLYMSRINQLRIRRYAELSQRRRYAADFVCQQVDASKVDDRWGIDYLECGIVKFLRAQGAEELAPCMCKMDYIVFPAMGLNLHRTGTIAEGFPLCDFRLSFLDARLSRRL